MCCRTIPRQGPITLLPYEILQEIFMLHVWANKSSPYDLSRTCRTWYHTASTTSMLWSKLYFGTRQNLVDSPDRVCCTTLASLATALGRIGEISFELSIACKGIWLDDGDIEHFRNSVDSKWLSRCRSLIWLHMSALSGWHKALPLFSSAQYLALKELEVWSISSPIAPELDAFMKQVQDTATKLRSVTFEGQTSDWSFIRLNQYPKLLNRIKRLRMATPQRSIWTGLGNLEELEIVNQGVNFHLPSSKKLRRVLIIGTGNLSIFPPDIYGQLTKVTIQSDRYWWIQCPPYMPKIIMHSLECLEVRGTLLSIPPIEAPKLDTLILLTSPSSRRDALLRQRESKFQPRIFRVDKPLGDPELLNTLEHIWDGVEELQITILRPSDSIGTKFTRALCGTPDPLYPRLRRLSVLCPLRRDQQALQTPTVTVMNLGKIAAALEHRGQLERVSCGSYDSRMVPFSSELREHWDIRWQDIY
jgi:hypothetical protein